MISSAVLLFASVATFSRPAWAFCNLPSPSQIMTAARSTPPRTLASAASSVAGGASSSTGGSKSYLYVPSERDERYQGNVARYLLDLHDERATFNFCGGMMFQLVLSEKLRSHLETVASSSSDSDDRQPIMHPSSQSMMNRTPGYQKSSSADNVSIFHGRELRQVPSANGGMGFVLQLSYADPSGAVTLVEENAGAVAGKGADAAWTGKAVDPQGWSAEEIATYDGWRGDSFRQWRNRPAYEAEGFGSFSTEFGKDAFGLNHRFYLHLDDRSRMWLSAEDGCEGTPAEGGGGLLGRLGGILFGN